MNVKGTNDDKKCSWRKKHLSKDVETMVEMDWHGLEKGDSLCHAKEGGCSVEDRNMCCHKKQVSTVAEINSQTLKDD